MARILSAPAPAAALALLSGAAAAAPDAPVRMNDIQVVGSHNSFKRQIPPVVLASIAARDPAMARSLNYYHLPLADQLDRGVRQIEIDVFADPTGGRYADPSGERAARAAGQATGFDRGAMLAPGFKVFHVPDVDYLSHCPTLIGCLRQVDAWSRAHPRHLPLMITINAHDTPIKRPGITDPLQLDAASLDALDAEIRSVLAPNRMIVPDDVRGTRATLRDGALSGGWPELADARGKLFFVFDVPTDIGDRYRAGHPSLKGRVMFGFFDAGQDEAATIVVQDPLLDEAKIREWVKAGYVIRARSDADTREARANDHRKATAAAASGAQAVSTDYYPGAPDPGKFGFTVTLPGGAMQRCNPLRRVRTCHIAQRDR